MRAVVCSAYGSPDVLRPADAPQPRPGARDVLVRVHATAVTAADTMMRRGTPLVGRVFLGLRRPRQPITGTGFAGVVAEVGGDVRGFVPGDEVLGETGTRFGANAEYVTVPYDGVLVAKPPSVSFAEAAPLTDGALTAWSFLRDVVTLERGDRILVVGASGSVGSAAVQLARHLGARVTGVCGPAHVELVRSLGAEEVVDRSREDVTALPGPFDVVFDAVGASSFARCRHLLAPRGTYLSPVLGLRLLAAMLLTVRGRGRRARFSATGLRKARDLRPLLEELTGLLAAGTLRTVVDRTYVLEQVPEAHRYVERGHKAGNVVAMPVG